jgi:predicted dehydrogenase/threonine dehydrogenase-like Zn-dependent dehydrogenase
MKQVLLSGRGEVAVFDVPLPDPAPKSVLVRNAYSLISTGTESAAVSRRTGWMAAVEKVASSSARAQKVWRLARQQGFAQALGTVQQKLADWTPIGYSCCGEVVEVSDDVTEFTPGDWVACMGAGVANHAEFVVVPVNLAAKLPTSVDPKDAAFGAVACIAQQGVRILHAEAGESIAVIGLGLVGSLTAMLAQAMGYSVFGIDLSAKRVERCKHQLDIPCWTLDTDVRTAIEQATKGRGVDGAIITAATSSSQPVNLAFDLCRQRGNVSVVGDVGLDLDRKKMYRKELGLRVSCSYGPGRYDKNYELNGHDYPTGHVRWTQQRNLEFFLELLSTRRIDIDPLISRTFAVQEGAKAYAAVKQADAGVLGVLFDHDHQRGVAAHVTPDARVLRTEVVRPPVNGDRVAIGLIGSGSFAKYVHLPNLKRLADSFSIDAVASRSGANAALAARQFGIPFATSRYQLLLDDPRIDAVLVCTRHATHAKIVLDSLAAGKHVFVEKPMCLTADEGGRIEALARESGLVVRVGFNRRFAPALASMRAAIGSTGRRMLTCRASLAKAACDHWSNTKDEGGRFLGEGVHFLDLCNWFVGLPPRSVSARYLGEPSAINPNLIVTLGYPDGSGGSVVYTTIGDQGIGKEYYEAFGNGRAARCDDFRSLRVHGIRLRGKSGKRRDKGHAAQLREFADTVLGRTNSEHGADASAGTLATWMATAALESAESGEEIALSSPRAFRIDDAA